MANRIFKYDLTIKEGHLDTFGHVNNATYLQLFEEARWEFGEKNGYGLKKIMKTKQGPVILELTMRFIRELKLRQKISIFSQTLEYNSKIGVLRQWITEEDGNLCTDAEMKFGLFDTEQRKLILPTEDWLNSII